MGIVRRLTWSYSRGNAWQECARAVYYEHLSKGDLGLEMAPLLRRLRQSPAASAGIVVDELVKSHLFRLRAHRPVMPDLASIARQALASHIRNSPARAEILRGGLEPWENEHIFLSDYYLRGHEPGEVQRAFVQAEAATEGFLSSPLLARIQRCAPDDLLIPTRGVPTFPLYGTDVFAAYDLLVRHGDKVVVVDWKSGRRTERSELAARRQLGIYARYVISTLGYKPENVFIQAAWLRESPDWEIERVPLSLLELVEEEIGEQVAEVRARLQPAQEEGPIHWLADIRRFEPRPQVRRCIGCRFLELCAEGRLVVDLG